MQGKTVLITGGNSGIGKIAAIELAKKGAQVVLACRASDKTDAAVADIKKLSANHLVAALPVDLSSLQSVRELAQLFLTQYDRLDVLLNNAGVFPLKKQLSVDGYELQFAVNHLSHFLLTDLLRDRLIQSQPARIINVSSTLHLKGKIDFDSFAEAGGYDMQKAYGQSKLANVIFTRSLAQRLRGSGVTVNCLHPGAVSTDIVRHMPWPIRWLLKLLFTTPEKGAKTSVLLASAPTLLSNTGEYYDQEKLTDYSPLADDKELCERLWQCSEQMVGITQPETEPA